MNLLQLREKTRDYLDDTSSVRFITAEVNRYINQAYRHYYNRLVNGHYDRLLTTPLLMSATASVASIALPADFEKAKILYRVLDNRKVPMQFRSNYEQTEWTSGGFGTGLGYMPSYDFIGSNIILNPIPEANIVDGFELVYWPVMTELSADTDNPVSGFSTSWHELICLRAAIIAKSNREEEDVVNISNMLMNEEGPFNDMLLEMSTARQFVEPFYTGG